MNRNAKGLILYPVAILMIFLLVLTFRDRLEESQTWNDRQLESALEELPERWPRLPIRRYLTPEWMKWNE